MLHKQTINDLKWIDGVNIPEDSIKKILKTYDIHTLDIKACIEGNQRIRVDKYPSYVFVVLHFPKYNAKTKIYEGKAIYIFISKIFLITFRDFSFAKIHQIFTNYSNIKQNSNIDGSKVISSYIVYEILQVMLEKVFHILKIIRLDIQALEKKVFEGPNSSLVRDIMLKKRSIVLLSHIFKPWLMVLKQLQDNNEIKVYFEELEDKCNQLISEIDIVTERIDSVEDALKSMLDIKSNFTIKVLTIFSAFLLPLTLITSFYGMNIKLPYTENSFFIFCLLGLSLISMLIIYGILKRKGKF